MVGGIMINCDGEKTDKFMPLKFEIRTKDSNRDVFEETFKIKSFRHYSSENIMSKLRDQFNNSIKSGNQGETEAIKTDNDTVEPSSAR